ncbi:WD repeat-containing protein 74 [Quaeritorhiza haematococci]|nr:WD repeat-containing protein 74 [Quaeritorhiza haematococci]
MQLFVGTEVGLVKAVKLPPPQSEAAKKAKETKEKSEGKEKTGDKSDAGDEIVTKNWGSVDRALEVQITKFLRGDNQVLVGRKNGSVEYMSAETGNVLRQLQVFTPSLGSDGKPKLNKHRKPEHFVGLHQTSEGALVTCTDLGTLNCYDMQKMTNGEATVTHFSLGQDLLFRMRGHATQTNILATGGDERELCLWDINASSSSTTPSQKTQTQQTSTPITTLTPTWKAKNVKNNFLDLRQPVWVTDLQFLSKTDATKVIIGTGYHQIRLYDTKAARRPVVNVEYGEYPVRAVAVCPNEREVIFSDTVGNMSILDLRMSKVSATFKGLAGCITSIYPFETKPWVYVKQRLTDICVNESFESALLSSSIAPSSDTDVVETAEGTESSNTQEGDAEPGNDDDKLWESMAAVVDGEGKKKKKKLAEKSSSSGLKRSGSGRGEGLSKKKKQKSEE